MYRHAKRCLYCGLLISGLLILAGGKGREDQYVIEKDSDKFIFQQGYAFKRANTPVQLSLSGTHYEMGLQYGVLLKHEIRAMADGLDRLIAFHAKEMNIPKSLMNLYFKLQIKRLSCKLPKRLNQELQGISEGSGVNMDTLYAINMFDDLMHTMGCTSVVALADDGTIIHGRNEDLYLGMELGMKQVIVQYHPKGYHSFVSVSFPGFVGVSTGYNSNGLGYSHHSRYAKNANFIGYSQFSVPRMALEECSTIDEVISFYNDKPIVVGDAHTWSDRNRRTGCIIETAPDPKHPIKVVSMDRNVLWHINRYIDPYYAANAENEYSGDAEFNNAREHNLTHRIDKAQTQFSSMDDVISVLKEEKGLQGENYNLSGITRGICNIDTQQMIIFHPHGAGFYLARNYYLAGKSAVYFIPTDFNEPPHLYKNSEALNPVVEEVAQIKESMISRSEQIRRLKELTTKYPNQGTIDFMIAKASFDLGNLPEWATFIEKAYERPSSLDQQEVLLEAAKVAFYKKDLPRTAELLSEINAHDLWSFKSKGEWLYLNAMAYKACNQRRKSLEYQTKFRSLVKDGKTRSKIIKKLKTLKK